MGLRLALCPMFELSYRLPLSNGLTEHEYGHVYFARSDALPEPNPQEVGGWRYLSLPDIQHEIEQHPAYFTPWFLHAFPGISAELGRFNARGHANLSSSA